MFLGLFVIFQLFFSSTFEEEYLLWKESEIVDLSQGNFLTSITKLQRVIAKSQILKGVILYDSNGLVLIQFGKYKSSMEVESSTIGMSKSINLFSGVIADNIGGLKIVLYAQANFLYLSLVLIGLFSLTVVGGFHFLLLRHSSEKQKFVAVAQLREVEMKNRLIELENSFASQVAHDIRSPLAALNMVVGTVKELPEDKRIIIRGAVQRINDIANGLLKQGKHPGSGQSTSIQSNESVMLVALLDTIISEKRTQYREKINVEIDGNLAKGYGLFAKVNHSELSRVISNLVNNSVEAFENAKGKVSIGIRAENEKIVITVDDNGKGIPTHILTKLGERGVSHGKENSSTGTGLISGSGLGVAHARETIEAAGGEFSISSELGKGTLITLTLPRCETPSWFVEKIQVQPNQVIVSVDDDQSIHQIWSGRFASAISLEAYPKHLKFTSLEEFEVWAKTNHRSENQYLVDYEFLGQGGNGLDTIERLQIQNKSILVTSRYEEPQIQSKAQALKLKILPKGLAPFVPIELDVNRTKFDAVLIDDDELVHMTWKMIASEKTKNILCFATPEEFFLHAPTISLDTPVYVDVSLAKCKRGEVVATEVYSIGFTEIYLATGYEASTIEKPECVRSIVGKAPTF